MTTYYNPYGPSDEFDATPQHEYPIKDLPDKQPTVQEPADSCDEEYYDEESEYEGQECPVCGYDLDSSGECTGNGCGADLCS